MPWGKQIPKQDQHLPAVKHADFDNNVGAVRLSAPAKTEGPASSIQQVAYHQSAPVAAPHRPAYCEFSPAVERDYVLPAGTDPAVVENVS